jgi:hypothetical protein
VTEPVAGTAPVRRTVRVATALVAGQALLCGVIGWVTFGPSEPGPRAARTVEPLAPLPVVPSVVVPPAPPRASPPSRPASSRSVRAKSSASRSPAAPKRPRVTTEPPPPADEPPPTLVIAPPDQDKTRTPPSPGLVGTGTPTPTASVQGPVTVGGECEPEGAPGVTADDRRVRCVRAGDGDLRWQII